MTSGGFTDVTHEEAVQRARSLAPVLRERADRAESARQMEKDTLADLHRAGLFRFPGGLLERQRVVRDLQRPVGGPAL